MLLLIVALGIDGAALQRALLVPHYSPLAYLAVSFSLSYMCLTLPWSCRMYFGSSDERKATRPSLIIHHAFVVLAERVYLLTQTSPWPGSAACGARARLIGGGDVGGPREGAPACA